MEFWGHYLARGLENPAMIPAGRSVDTQSSSTDINAGPCSDVNSTARDSSSGDKMKETTSCPPKEPSERESYVSRHLEDVFRTQFVLTPFSRTMAIEYVRKQIMLGGSQFDRVLQFLINSINGRPFRSLAQRGASQLIPGLTALHMWDTSSFEWVHMLESHFNQIKAEFLALRDKGKAFQPYRSPANSTRAVTGKEGVVATSEGSWNVCYLKLHDMDFKDALSHCPVTARCIDSVPRQYNHSLFSALAAHTHVKPHYGPTNKKLRCHLPLVVPDSNLCTITVADHVIPLQEGKCIVFDDSFYHEAHNKSDKPRIVLIIDVWHPDFTDEEVKFLSFVEKAQFRAATMQMKSASDSMSDKDKSVSDNNNTDGRIDGGRGSASAGRPDEAGSAAEGDDVSFYDIISAMKAIESPANEIWG